MDVRLIEAASEIGAGKRGASMGMSALRVAAWKNGSDLFGHAEESILRDENDVLYEDDNTPNAHHIDGLIRFESDLAYEVYKFLRSNIFPMVIGGDHSIAIGSVSGTKMAFPTERLGVIWIDAHADLHSPWTTPSGNVHGMPLSLLMNIEKKGRNKPRVFTMDTWDRLRKIGMSGPKLEPRDLVFIALRDYEPEEEAIIKEHGIKVITVEQLRARGAEGVVADTLAYLSACDKIHVSFDVDSLDPSISVGTGTPVPHGLNLDEARALLTGFCTDVKTATLDVVEINPALDTGNAMAEAVLTVLEPLFPHSAESLTGLILARLKWTSDSTFARRGITSTVEVEHLGNNLFRLIDNDFFNCRLTRGTEIKTEPREDGSHEFIAVTRPSELVTRRFFLSPKYRESDYRVLGDELSKHGGFWQVDFGGFLTINIPKDFPYDLDQVMTDLDMRLTEVVDDLEP